MPIEHDTFISPFTWRYGSAEMRKIWSEIHKRLLMRCVWVALATVQYRAGHVSVEQLADLQSQVDNVDALRCGQSAILIETRLRKLLDLFARRIEESAYLPIARKLMNGSARRA